MSGLLPSSLPGQLPEGARNCRRASITNAMISSTFTSNDQISKDSTRKLRKQRLLPNPRKKQWQFRHGLWLHMTVMNMIRARSYKISNFTFIFLWFSIDFPQPPSNITSVKIWISKTFGLLIVAGLAEQACFTWAVLAHPPHSLPKSHGGFQNAKGGEVEDEISKSIKKKDPSCCFLFLPFFPTTIHYIHQDIFSFFLVHPCVLQLKVNRKPGNHSVKARGFTSHVAAVAASGKTVGGLVQQLPQSLGICAGMKVNKPYQGP